MQLARSVFYRYWFFDWLFKDASKGNLFEQSAALRWNKEHAYWLFTYLRRWFFLTIFFYGLGAVVEVVSPTLSAFFYVPSVLSVGFNSVIGVMIAWLKLIP